MSRAKRRMMLVAAAAMIGFVALGLNERWMATGSAGLMTAAEARIGRPLTPLSYAGAARRTVRRGAYAAGAAAATGAAAGAYYQSGCYQAVDQYGRVYNHCP